MIEAFVWTDQFATGIESVDTQHAHLVQLVNQVGNLMIESDSIDPPQLQALFKQLADYARYHFIDEERVMTEGGLDAEVIARHKEHHRHFTEQVVEMWQGRAGMANPAETLHGFLSAWLTFHILGEDQAMAREIVRVREGMSPQAAHALETEHGEHSTSALLKALQKLYGVLTQQNRDLAAFNATLESRILERTRELEKSQSQLLQSEKMASIGQLAAGVAHEINNPIGFVNSNLGTLERYVSDLLRVADVAGESPAATALSKEIDLPFLREDITALLAESRDGLERVRKIVANLKDFSHVDEAEWQHADLIAGLESTLSVVWHELKYKADIVRELVPLPLVHCIPAQINQVFVNLLINAAQAIPSHGTITLKSGQQGEQVWIEISDTGVGMTDEVKRHIFEPFFTTKPVGSGTGLGMSLAYDIIHKHDGRFDVDSAPGAGSRVRLWLPVAGPAD